MPHMDLILIPSSLTKEMVYNKMLSDFERQDMKDRVVKKRQFYNIWSKSFPKVKIRKV